MCLWFIPTYMGNSPSRSRAPRGSTVHIHVCGELPNAGGTAYAHTGSSPHTWGTHVPGQDCPTRGRFIPTYVGNSRIASRARFPPTGSSPHTWGTHQRRDLMRVLGRFIPTYVGNSWGGPASTWAHPVHPHMRGELALSSASSLQNAGSSPHALGTQDGVVPEVYDMRFIPTCVGNSMEGGQ